VKQRCCRSLPRCADCPALALLSARARRHENEQAILVAEVFAGRPPRQLPESVEVALAALRPQH
jgi:hypothetical protein